MKLVIQPKYTRGFDARPSLTSGSLSRSANLRRVELLGNLHKDYSIVVYFKENGKVGHKSRYTTGELAHHLMVEGQFAKDASRRGRPKKQMSVVYTKSGRARRDIHGKYYLAETTGYKKKWDFVKIASKRHGNWKREIFSCVDDVLRMRIVKGLLGGSINSVNFYTAILKVANKVKNDIIDALRSLETPQLSKNTIAKKKHDKILIETMNLLRSISVKVERIEPRKRSRILYGRKFAGNNTPMSKEDQAIIEGYLKAGIKAEGYLASVRAEMANAEHAEEVEDVDDVIEDYEDDNIDDDDDDSI